MFDITYESGLGKAGELGRRVETDVSVGVGPPIISVCHDVHVAVEVG